MGFLRVDVSRRFGIAAFAAFALVACAESADSDGISGAGGTVGGTGGIGGSGAVGGAAGLGGVGGVGGTGGVGVGGTGGGQPGSDVPCNVETVVKARCGTCHGASPIGGAPMSLVTLADFTKDYTVVSTSQLAGQTMKVHQLVKIRINQEQMTAPMPQGLPMPAEELTMLNSWLTGGAVGGTACGDVNPMGGGVGGVGGGGVGGTGGTDPINLCDGAEAYVPLTERDGETCYEFLTHNGGWEGDPFIVQPDESYNQLYYDIPWPEGTVGTRFGANFDNEGVLHHWLGFETNEDLPHGTVSKNVTGSTGGALGGGFTTKLFGGWAVGGCNVEFPSDMGLELAAPSSGNKIMIQWHHYNFTGSPQPDASKVQICTVPAGTRPNTGGLTWLGTEDLGGNGLLGGGMPPGVESKFSGTCLNETSAPVTIVAFWPHMHEIGTNMFTEVLRSGASAPETVFDKPFQFDHQVHYDLAPNYVVLQPGDKIRAECTFFNSTQANVAFGQSTKQEMCYQFAFSYPAGALDKPENASLIGAANTCWGDDF